MRLTNKAYDILKWVCLIALPAFCVFYQTLQLPNSEEICRVITAVDALLGTLIGISCYTYNKEEIHEEVEQEE